MDHTAYRELADRAATHWYAVERRQHLRAVLQTLDLPPDARVLEIGCGPGSNLAMLEEFGTVTAIEPSPVALEILREAYGPDPDVREGWWPADAALLGDERFDVIVMLDVLEHIVNDSEALAAARDSLRPGRGRLLITVPAHPWMWSVHDEHLHHVRRYTRRGLATLIAESGLVIESIGAFNTLLFPAAVAARVIARALRRTTSPGGATPGPVVNRILGTVFRLERTAVRRGGLPIGLSLLAVVRSA